MRVLRLLRVRRYSVSVLAFPIMFYIFFGIILRNGQLGGVHPSPTLCNRSRCLTSKWEWTVEAPGAVKKVGAVWVPRSSSSTVLSPLKLGVGPGRPPLPNSDDTLTGSSGIPFRPSTKPRCAFSTFKIRDVKLDLALLASSVRCSACSATASGPPFLLCLRPLWCLKRLATALSGLISRRHKISHLHEFGCNPLFFTTTE